jgi:hypothetical protein
VGRRLILAGAIEWTAASAIIALVLICFIFYIGRDRKNRRVRIGVFVERQRFEDTEDDDA